MKRPDMNKEILAGYLDDFSFRSHVSGYYGPCHSGGVCYCPRCTANYMATGAGPVKRWPNEVDRKRDYDRWKSGGG